MFPVIFAFQLMQSFFVPVFILSGQVLPHRHRRGWEE